MRIDIAQTLVDQQTRLVRRESSTLGPDAQDLASEAVTRAIASPPPDGNLGPWVERIFQNLKTDRWRTRRPEVPADSLPLASTCPSAEERLLYAEQTQLLTESLATLPPDLRSAVSLRVLEEQDEVTVGHTLGIAPATVRSRIHRALCRLRESLAHARALLPVRWPRPSFSGIHATSALAAQAAVAVCIVGALGSPPDTVQAAPIAPAAATHDVLYDHRTSAPAVPIDEAVDLPFHVSAPKSRPTPSVKAKVPLAEHGPLPSANDTVLSAPPRSIAWPDIIFVDLPTLAPAAAPFVEIPADFRVAFEKMIEETL